MTKPLINATEVYAILPGKGRGAFEKLIAARWLAPVSKERPPLYRSRDVAGCLERMDAGECPKPVYRWRTALGQDSAHLVDTKGRPVCNTREREWMGDVSGRQCTRCQGAGKTLRVEEA